MAQWKIRQGTQRKASTEASVPWPSFLLLPSMSHVLPQAGHQFSCLKFLLECKLLKDKGFRLSLLQNTQQDASVQCSGAELPIRCFAFHTYVCGCFLQLVMCVGVPPAGVYVHHTRACYTRRSVKDTGSFQAGVTDGCKPPGGC